MKKPFNSKFLSRDPHGYLNSIPKNPNSYKNSLVWRWLQYEKTKLGDEAGNVIKALRKRVDMPRQFPNQTYFRNYLIKAHIDVKVIERVGLRLWHMYAVYRDFMLRSQSIDGGVSDELPKITEGYKLGVVWAWLQVESAHHGNEIGDIIANLRQRIDMPRMFPHKTAIRNFMTKAGIEPELVEQYHARLWSLYVQYRDFSTTPVIPSPDGKAVDIMKKVYKSNPLLKRD